MRESTEKVVIESGGALDGKLATVGWYPPQFLTGDLPAYAGVEGMLVYSLTLTKLLFSTGSAWETVTSST